jgi:hypothetical protein
MVLDRGVDDEGARCDPVARGLRSGLRSAAMASRFTVVVGASVVSWSRSVVAVFVASVVDPAPVSSLSPAPATAAAITPTSTAPPIEKAMTLSRVRSRLGRGDGSDPDGGSDSGGGGGGGAGGYAPGGGVRSLTARHR